MEKDKSVLGIYSTRGDVESAIHGFRDAGFSHSDISALFLKEEVSEEVLVTEDSTKGAQGAVLGASSGAAVGGAIGWLVGTGALVIPGIGPVIAAGPLVALLAGVGVGGALGGFTGSLVGLGISESEAQLYEGRLTNGGVLVAIHCENKEEIERAREIMEITGAENITSRPSVSEPPVSERKTSVGQKRTAA